MSVETQVQDSYSKLFAELSPEEAAGLSKALFPATHTSQVVVLGKPRELRPLTIKWSKKLRACMQPWSEQLDRAVNSPEKIDIDLDLLEAIKQSAKIICEHYQWADITAAIDEEDISNTEIQTLVVAQVKLQGENDFLVVPLRVAVMVMQSAEIQQRRFQTMFGG